MGADFARRAASDGYKVALLSSSGKAERLAAELGGIAVTGSNRSTDDLKRLVSTTQKTWGRIDAVVNSAAHGPKGVVSALSDQEWLEGMEIYFLNVARIARLVTPIMEGQGGGAIVNISTYGVVQPSTLFPTSSVMRAALRSYTKIYAQTHAANNIRMNNVLPGFVNSMEMEADWMKLIPMGRFAEMSEISGLLSYLISDEAAYITGQDIVIDGGITNSL